jgi:hypothetical protein
MQRHRCTKCRNPIRSVAVARHGETEDAWFHVDCWDEVCSSEQEKYEREVESGGIPALLEPYAARGGGPSSSLSGMQQVRV